MDMEYEQVRRMVRSLIITSFLLVAFFASCVLGVILSDGTDLGYIAASVFFGILLIGLYYIRSYLRKTIKRKEEVY